MPFGRDQDSKTGRPPRRGRSALPEAASGRNEGPTTPRTRPERFRHMGAKTIGSTRSSSRRGGADRLPAAGRLVEAHEKNGSTLGKNGVRPESSSNVLEYRMGEPQKSRRSIGI